MKTQPISAHHELPAKAYPNESPDLKEARAGGFVGRISSAARATSKRRNGSVVARGSIPGAFRTQARNHGHALCGWERPGEGCTAPQTTGSTSK